MKRLLYILLILAAAACSNNHRASYTAEYAVVDSIAYNIETNVAAVTSVTDRDEDYQLLTVEYPEYGATMNVGVVMLDSARLVRSINNRFIIFEKKLRGADYSYIDNATESPLYSWVFTHTTAPIELSFLATDSMSMMVSGEVEFSKKPADSIAVDNIREDIYHLVRNLKLQ